MSVAAMRVPTIFTAVDKFSGVVGTMERNIKSFGAASEGASMRIGRKMTAIGTRAIIAGAAVGAIFVKPIDDAIQFEDQMGKINTILHATPTGLSKISKEVRDLAVNSVNGLDNITESYYELLSAGVKQPNVMGILKAAEKLSIGGVGTMQDATELMLAKQGAFASEGLTPTQSANQAQKVMKHGKGTLAQLSPTYSEGAVPFGLAGGTSSQYDAMIAGLTSVNQTQATAISQIGLMTRSAEKGAGAFKKIFKELNVKSFAQLVKRNSKDVVKSFSQILKQGEKMGYNINQIWGRAGASTGVALLLKNQKAINQYTTAYKDILNDANNELDKAYKERSDNSKSKLARFVNQMKDLRIEIGNALLPAVIDLLKYLTPMIKSFAKWVKDNPNTIKGIAGLAVALGALGVVVTAGGWIATAYGWLLKLFTFLAGVGWAGMGASILAFFESISVSMTAFWIATSEIWIPVALILGAIALIIATFIYWDDITAWFSEQQKKWTSTIGDTWVDLTSTLENSGFGEYFENIGEKLNPILKMFETMFRFMQNLNFMGMGGVFGFAADTLGDMQSKVTSRAENSMFNPNSSAAGSWGDSKKDNLAGDNTGLANEIAKAMSNQQFEIIVNDKSGIVEGVKVNGKNYAGGIPAKTGSTTGNWWNP